MPHLAAQKINNWLIYSSSNVQTKPALDVHTAQEALAALEDDGRGLFYSSVVTLVDALRGIVRGHFSWATVKLYYSAFYSVRSILCMNNVALFYPPTGKPYSLRCEPGQKAVKEHGVTHKVVWNILKRELPSSPLHGVIVADEAHVWMKKLREDANYKTPKFPDPTVPAHFSSLDSIGVGRALHGYVDDQSMLYAFDPDHAAIAFPIECLRRAHVAVARTGNVMDEQDAAHIAACLAEMNLDPAIFDFN